MKVRFLAFVFFLLSFSHCGIAKSEISKDYVIKAFTDANEKYLQAMKDIAAKNLQGADQKLKEAVLQYETILAGGFVNGQIYYNLGNAYYRLGESGKAILNYRRAERLMPRNADLYANLKLVKSSVEDKELSSETPATVRRIFFWFFLLNQNELTLIAVSIYVILMVLLFLLITFRYARLKRVITGFSAVLFVMVVSLGIKVFLEQGVNRGVIISPKCEVRYGPGEEYEPKFEIHSGAECVIEDEKDDWYRVYVKVGVKQDIVSEAGAEEKVSKGVRRGWLQKRHVDVI
ncbi:MAG: tetratricopeptide repeat protein [Candidatus Brocadia sp.]|jgi:hypothetical protein